MKTDLKVFSTQALDFTPSFASLYVKYYSQCSWRRPNDNPAHKFLQNSLLVNSLFLLVLYYLYFYYCATYKSNQFKSRYLYTQLSVILPQNSFELNGKKIIFVPMLSSCKEWQCLFATILHGTKLRHPFLSRDYTSYFIFLFPSMRSLVPGYFAIIFIAEFETDLIRQSNNKIVINGDVILVVFPPFQGTEE